MLAVSQSNKTREYQIICKKGMVKLWASPHEI